jgi:hypothetical protein
MTSMIGIDKRQQGLLRTMPARVNVTWAMASERPANGAPPDGTLSLQAISR